MGGEYKVCGCLKSGVVLLATVLMLALQFFSIIAMAFLPYISGSQFEKHVSKVYCLTLLNINPITCTKQLTYELKTYIPQLAGDHANDHQEELRSLEEIQEHHREKH